jgi:NTP pyrophosphatase (non-canonical NTP hydrolase)
MTDEPKALVSKYDRDEIARVLFQQRQTDHDWEDSQDADPDSDAGTLRSICFDDADAVIAALLADQALSTHSTPSQPVGERAGLVEHLRPEVLAFARLMERELRANDHKPGWKNDRIGQLAPRVVQEADELLRAVRRLEERWGEHLCGGPDRGSVRMSDADMRQSVVEEAADVANMAMMVADVLGALPALATPVSAPVGEGRHSFKVGDRPDTIAACHAMLSAVEFLYRDAQQQYATLKLLTTPTTAPVGEPAKLLENLRSFEAAIRSEVAADREEGHNAAADMRERRADELAATIAYIEALSAPVGEEAVERELREKARGPVPDDVPEPMRERYVEMQLRHTEDEIRMCREHFGGDWLKRVAGLLHMAGVMAPPEGSYHHMCLVNSRALGVLASISSTNGLREALSTILSIIAEMVEIAVADEDSEIAEEWPIDNRAQVDRWQSQIAASLAALSPFNGLTEGSGDA